MMRNKEKSQFREWFEESNSLTWVWKINRFIDDYILGRIGHNHRRVADFIFLMVLWVLLTFAVSPFLHSAISNPYGGIIYILILVIVLGLRMSWMHLKRLRARFGRKR